MKTLSYASAVALVAFAMAGPVAAATVQTFDGPVTLSNTQQAGAWYTDRYAPNSFTGGVAFDGRSVLEVGISSAQSANNRPAAFNSSFYNTQGRKFDLEAGTTSMSIELYVDDAWATTGSRMAGIWGTGFEPDGADLDTDPDIAAYPIFEFTSDGGVGRFRAYEVTTGSWLDLGLPGGFAYDSWYKLDINLASGLFTYSVGDLSVSTDANGATSIGNVILQGHNSTSGVDYAVRWDNLTTAVPEPATWGLMILGFGLAGTAMRRRRALSAA